MLSLFPVASRLAMKPYIFLLLSSTVLMVVSKNIDPVSAAIPVIVCPDAVSTCPMTSTCCISTNGEYSCCPLANGVCCSDHIHCCPENYKCDLRIFKCDRTIGATRLTMAAPLNKRWMMCVCVYILYSETPICEHPSNMINLLYWTVSGTTERFLL